MMNKEKLVEEKNRLEKKSTQNMLLAPPKSIAENKIPGAEKMSAKSEPVYHYATVSEATNELNKKGFTVDFNLEENCITCGYEKFKNDEFEIKEVYRYEGNSDPGDEAVVYGIESKNGVKGILVGGYGNSSDNISPAMLNKLALKKSVTSNKK